jgi:hypothetical protein
MLNTDGFGCTLTKKIGDQYGEPIWFPSLGQASRKLLTEANVLESTDLLNRNIAKALEAIVLREERDRLTKEIAKRLRITNW